MSEENETAPAIEVGVQDVASSSFLDSVDDQYRSDPSISKFSNINDLAKEHVNLQSLLGRKGVVVPNAEDTEETWQRYRSEVGIPETHDGYSKSDFQPPENVGWDSDFESSIAEAAHKLNITDDQFSGLLNAYANGISESVKKADALNDAAHEESQALLTKEWGASYDAKVNMAGTALHHITDGKPESLAEIHLSDGTMLGNNPNFIRLMAQVGSQMQERGLIDGEAVNSLAMTPDEAQQRLGQLMADPEKSAILFSQDFHPAKAELVKERERLLSFAYPQE